MNYELYERLIMTSFVALAAVFIPFIIGAFIYLIYFFIQIYRRKRVNKIYAFLCCVIIVWLSILTIDLAMDSFYDVNNQAYIVYKGKFVIDEEELVPGISYFMYIPDKNGIQLSYTQSGLDEGEYTGIVIYGEKTGKIVEVQTDD